jgi:hypothetical protein
VRGGHYINSNDCFNINFSFLPLEDSGGSRSSAVFGLKSKGGHKCK